MTEVFTMMWGTGMGWWGWAFMGLTTVLLWGAVIAGIVAIFRGPGSASRPSEPTPREVLDERFARGEIDAEEYRARRSVLRSGG